MIYATKCIGEEWNSKYVNSVNKFCKKNDLHILTDNNTLFLNGICYPYQRDVFSYYEKINHILNISEKYKERVTYIDSDWLEAYDTKNKLDNDSLYTYSIFNIFKKPVSNYISVEQHPQIKENFKKINHEVLEDWYIPEAIISFPYREDLSVIKKDFNILQPPHEKMFNTKPHRREVTRYSRVGVGYGEGLAITAIASKYKIKVKDYSEFPNRTWRKEQII